MWDDAKQLNAVAAGLALVAAGALAWGALAWTFRQPVFEIREVVITAPLERASAAHLETVIRDELAGTFFTMNIDRARGALAAVPWVRRVALRRQWRQRLEVTIEEHEPLARWNGESLVNPDGEVFNAEYDGDLPQFEGADGRAAEVTARYREWSAALAPLSLVVREVRVSPRGGWRLSVRGPGGPLDIELGRDEPDERLARFVAVYGRTVGTLVRAGTRIDRVDLRYRNGFAARVPGFKERSPRKAGA
jgi:cell division protein FtsQ